MKNIDMFTWLFAAALVCVVCAWFAVALALWTGKDHYIVAVFTMATAIVFSLLALAWGKHD